MFINRTCMSGSWAGNHTRVKLAFFTCLKRQIARIGYCDKYCVQRTITNVFSYIAVFGHFQHTAIHVSSFRHSPLQVNVQIVF